tara:strand:- start:285 stop:593 length:309 start_codon:yes stop_codon:yes gene_type:complete
MNNILYTVKELNNDKIIDNTDSYNIELLVYNTYNVKQLSYILQYYDISKGRMCKDEIIQTIILFETDENNLNIVNKRKYLWSVATQLKNDDFFGKYIVIDIK